MGAVTDLGDLFDHPAEHTDTTVAGPAHAVLLGDASPTRTAGEDADVLAAAAGLAAADRCPGCGALLPDDAHIVDRASRSLGETSATP